jgi:hypothetical protein
MRIPARGSYMPASDGPRQSLRMATKPRAHWGQYPDAKLHSGLSKRLLQDLVRSNLIRSSVVRKPGSKRGVRLIDMQSLDEFIERGIGGKTELEMNANRRAKQS